MEKIKREPIKITAVSFGDKDFGLLDVVINVSKPQPAVSILVNDDSNMHYDIYLRVDPNSQRVVGATIFHADKLFAELAQAFANKDLGNPNVRFFLEKLLEQFAHEPPLEKSAPAI
jgi:hypothetical protein